MSWGAVGDESSQLDPVKLEKECAKCFELGGGGWISIE